jgi:hypothetical protein
MSHKHGDFILLQDGKGVCYASDYDTIKDRLTELFAKNPAADFVIAQVVGTVDRPKTPVVHSVYDSKF